MMISAGLSQSAAFSAYKNIWRVADWIFPPSCAGCGKGGFCWCPDCDSKIAPMSSPMCERCGLPVNHLGWCDRCLLENPPFDFLRSYSEYTEPLRSAIIRMKEYPDYGLGLALSAYLQTFFSKLIISPTPVKPSSGFVRRVNR
jgi:predicted amidophosphoribosyltransferase